MDSEVSNQGRCAACSKIGKYVLDQEAWHQKRCGLAALENLMRIHIIGGPGSGKTTLAGEISAYLDFEVHELDKIAFSGPHFVERSLLERRADVHLIAQRPTWITEGLFLLWTDELLTTADIIIWLDNIGWRRGVWRITRRFIVSAFTEVRIRRGWEKFMRLHDYALNLQQLIQVFLTSHGYYSSLSSPVSGQKESRASTIAHLATFEDKVVHCYNDEAVEAFLDYVRLCVSEEKEYG